MRVELRSVLIGVFFSFILLVFVAGLHSSSASGGSYERSIANDHSDGVCIYILNEDTGQLWKRTSTGTWDLGTPEKPVNEKIYTHRGSRPN